MKRFWNSIRTSLAAASVLVAISSCGRQQAAVPPLPLDIDPVVQNRDTTVSPGANFFEYANGGWLARNPIPPSERGWGIGWVVREDNYRQLRGICEESAVANAAHGTNEQKVGDFWATGMDSAATEAQGIQPLKPYLDEIAALQNRDDLLHLVARYQVLGFDPFYSMYIGQDEKNSEKYMIHLYQGGLGLPNRDYYFTNDSTTRRIRTEYGKHLTAMFRLVGESEAAAKQSSARVFRLETAMASRSRTLEALRDPWENYNKQPIAGMSSITPTIDWSRQFADMQIPNVDTLIVAQPEFFGLVDSLVKTAPLDDIKAYLRWSVVTSLANRLSSPIELENFRFFGTVMSGTTVMRPRWKRVLDAEEDAIGELLGQVWVKRYCSPATKARYEKLTADVIDAYRDRIKALPWMSEETKKRALVKLDKVTRKVGYPDKWRDYSSLDLDRSSYATNQVKANTWWFRHEADKLGKPIDRTEWDMTPQTYNAYYNTSQVEIVLPAAAFMIPGVADSLVDDAILYSYGGASTIGHEITHGFDDEGRQSDENGNLNPWWQPQDSVRFAERAERLVKQFNEYKVGEKHVRGEATLGENIADLGGVVLGYEAFKKTEQFKKGEKLNGLTPDQRYFLGYALAWMGRRRPEAEAQLIMSDVHSPQFLRVNGPLANVPEFYAAFGVKPGDAMYRPDSVRVTIW